MTDKQFSRERHAEAAHQRRYDMSGVRAFRCVTTAAEKSDSTACRLILIEPSVFRITSFLLSILGSTAMVSFGPPEPFPIPEEKAKEQRTASTRARCLTRGRPTAVAPYSTLFRSTLHGVIQSNLSRFISQSSLTRSMRKMDPMLPGRVEME